MRETYSTHLAIVTGCLVVAVTVLFALLQSPEILSVPSKAGGAMPHPIEAHRQCDSCHGPAGVKPCPIRHLGWSTRSCAKCHPPPAPTAGPAIKKASPISHPIKGQEDCIACHGMENGIMPAPSNHKGWQNEICRECHPPAEETPRQ